jgi:hypothetical protein
MRNSIDNATPAEWDAVAKPKHYNQGSIEAIEYIRQQLGSGLCNYYEGSVLKYMHRYKYKNGLEDLKKARWYLERLIEEYIVHGK